MSFRPGALVATFALALLGSAQTARADDPVRAEKLNKEANDLMYDGKHQEAIEKYKEALILSQQGKYYFNLCAAYARVGELGLALLTCDVVKTTGPNADLTDRTATLTAEIEGQIRAMGRDPADLRGGGGGDFHSGHGNPDDPPDNPDDPDGPDPDNPDNPDGPPDDPDNPDGPPDDPTRVATNVDTNEYRGEGIDIFKKLPPEHDYVWSLGGELFGAGVSLGGDDEGVYGGTGAGFRLHGEYLVAPAQKIGLQGHLGFMNVGEGDDSGFTDTLTVVEIGAGAYMHLFCQKRMCVTPLGSLQINGFQPGSMAEETSEVSFMSFGLRGEVAVGWALGPRYEHVVSIIPGFSVMTEPVGDYFNAGPEDFGLDGVSTAFYLGVGYTHRFSTPFGSSPFITLQ